MLNLNFYKIRTSLDIRPLSQEGDAESQARYDQIIQTVGQRADIEYINKDVLTVIEKSPADLGAFKGRQKKLYILVIGLDKERSGWSASELKTTLGNMVLTVSIKNANPKAPIWVGGAANNISAEKALFDLRSVKKKS